MWYNIFSKKDDWALTQKKYANIPGQRGIDLRNKYYAPFFLSFGNNVKIMEGCKFDFPERIVLSDNVSININANIIGSGGVIIGRHVMIGHNFFLHSANHNTKPNAKAYFERGFDYKSVKIGDNVLISAKDRLPH